MSSKNKKILMDVSIDQGGNFPESHPTTYEDPLYLDSFGNLRFGVVNIPSFCGKNASEALSRAVLPYTAALARNPKEAFDRIRELRHAINVQEGLIKIDAVRQAHQL